MSGKARLKPKGNPFVGGDLIPIRVLQFSRGDLKHLASDSRRRVDCVIDDWVMGLAAGADDFWIIDGDQ